ncbi:MAG: hypothetical protein WA702_16850 [Bradyrhizobium sp.]|jgi:hypothetical protein
MRVGHKKFEQIREGSLEYIVVLDESRTQATGHIRQRTDRTPPVWTWRITIDEADFASGAALSLRRAKEALLLAWRGFKRARRVLRPVSRRRSAVARPQEID